MSLACVGWKHPTARELDYAKTTVGVAGFLSSLKETVESAIDVSLKNNPTNKMSDAEIDVMTKFYTTVLSEINMAIGIIDIMKSPDNLQTDNIGTQMKEPQTK